MCDQQPGCPGPVVAAAVLTGGDPPRAIPIDGRLLNSSSTVIEQVLPALSSNVTDAHSPEPHDGQFGMMVPFGVMLGCFALASVVLSLWLMERRKRRQVQRRQQARDEEQGPRCSLDTDCEAPYLPKIPVIIVLPDNTTLNFGWQVEHSPCASPNAAAAAAAAGWCGQEGPGGKGGSLPPESTAATQGAGSSGASSGSSSGGGSEDGAGSFMVSAPSMAALSTAPSGELPSPGGGGLMEGRSGRRRPPLFSIEVHAPTYPDDDATEIGGSGI